MNGYSGLVGASLFAILVATAAAAGPEPLKRAEAEQLIKGNTAEGTNRWKKNMTWYFDPSGELRKRDDRGNKGKARWSIDPQGNLCFQDKHMKKELCGDIVPRADGGYDVNLEGRWNWNKVVPGNPHKL